MKVAILGPSKAALSMTHQLLELGASVRLFWPAELTQELAALHAQGVLIPSPWQQVTKRFLLAGQKPSVQSRFADLFRVSYLINPEPLIEQSREDQPEVYEKLTAEFMASLKRQLEMFEDVDVVIDASPGVTRRELGPGGPAIGESRLREGTIAYGTEVSDWPTFIGNSQEVALVGDGEQAARVLLSLQNWWQSKSHRIFHISVSSTPFANLTGPLKAQVQAFLQAAEAEQNAALQVWEKALAEWQELDDFIKAKKPRPEQPIPRYVVFSGHIVSGVDQLVDKSRTFLTIETSPFVTGVVQPENNQLELKTIGVDRVIGATGTRRPWERFHGLELQFSADQKDARDSQGTHPELGFFSLPGNDEGSRQSAIIAQLQKLFSPRES